MKVINKSNQKLVADRVRVANNPISRIVGLLNRAGLEKGEGLLIVPCNGIHSFFMRFRFDAVFLDKGNKVKYLIKNMKPWQLSPMIFGAHSILELPAATIEEADIKLNDALELIY
ncbi:MAG: hypothetical protein ACD_20C00337G0035 [uncultured bacterium]|nr:MAG: hypothetical protein ACD_20C00337G0035 [uncultured bacterium]HBH18345.1 DUF192 domain-containing protein [Cyanobacteria bacterium UBA9579]